MAGPTVVDTSLTGQSTGMESGMEGIDSPVSPDMSADMLPMVSKQDFMSAMQSSPSPMDFTGTGKATGTRADVINYAKSFLGVPYVWGGTSPKGFDCSGFTQYVAAKFGVKLPRLSQNQGSMGAHVALNQLQPGDLVLFPGDTNNGLSGPGHVAIYMGNGQIIEAPHTGENVRIRALGSKENVYGVHLNYSG